MKVANTTTGSKPAPADWYTVKQDPEVTLMLLNFLSMPETSYTVCKVAEK
jgi:hypothetical protein